jgi:hypothetical protein
MEKTSKPTVAGIFMIVSGALSIVGVLMFVIVIGFTVSFMDGLTGGADVAKTGVFFTFWAVVGVLVSAFSVVAGVFCLKRRLWGLALAGSILAVLQIFILGVPALVLVAMARDEFA